MHYIVRKSVFFATHFKNIRKANGSEEMVHGCYYYYFCNIQCSRRSLLAAVQTDWLVGKMGECRTSNVVCMVMRVKTNCLGCSEVGALWIPYLLKGFMFSHCRRSRRFIRPHLRRRLDICVRWTGSVTQNVSMYAYTRVQSKHRNVFTVD